MARFGIKRWVRAALIAAGALFIGWVFQQVATTEALSACRTAQTAVVAAIGDLGIFGLFQRTLANISEGQALLASLTGLNLPGIMGLGVGWLFALVITPIQIVRESGLLEWAIIGFELVAGSALLVVWSRKSPSAPTGNPIAFLAVPLQVIVLGTLVASLLWVVAQAGLFLFSSFLDLAAFCLGGGTILGGIYLFWVTMAEEVLNEEMRVSVDALMGGDGNRTLRPPTANRKRN